MTNLKAAITDALNDFCLLEDAVIEVIEPSTNLVTVRYFQTEEQPAETVDYMWEGDEVVGITLLDMYGCSLESYTVDHGKGEDFRADY